jgi:hypothetical protein
VNVDGDGDGDGGRRNQEAGDGPTVPLHLALRPGSVRVCEAQEHAVWPSAVAVAVAVNVAVNVNVNVNVNVSLAPHLQHDLVCSDRSTSPPPA